MSQQDGRPPGSGSPRGQVPSFADLQKTATGPLPARSRELSERDLPVITNSDSETRVTGGAPQGETVMVPTPAAPAAPVAAPKWVPGQAPLPQITLSTVNVKAHQPLPKPPPGPQISAAQPMPVARVPTQPVTQQLPKAPAPVVTAATTSSPAHAAAPAALPKAPSSMPGAVAPGSNPARPLNPALAKTLVNPRDHGAPGAPSIRAAGVQPLPPLPPRPPPPPAPAPSLPRAPTTLPVPQAPAKVPAHLLPTDPIRAAPDVSNTAFGRAMAAGTPAAGSSQATVMAPPPRPAPSEATVLAPPPARPAAASEATVLAPPPARPAAASQATVMSPPPRPVASPTAATLPTSVPSPSRAALSATAATLPTSVPAPSRAVVSPTAATLPTSVPAPPRSTGASAATLPLVRAGAESAIPPTSPSRQPLAPEYAPTAIRQPLPPSGPATAPLRSPITTAPPVPRNAPAPAESPPPATLPPTTLPPSRGPTIQPASTSSPFGLAIGPPGDDESTIAARAPGPPPSADTVAARPQSIPMETVAARGQQPPPQSPPAPVPLRAPGPLRVGAPLVAGQTVAGRSGSAGPVETPQRSLVPPARPGASTMPGSPVRLGPEFAVTQPGMPGPEALQALRRAAAEEQARRAAEEEAEREAELPPEPEPAAEDEAYDDPPAQQESPSGELEPELTPVKKVPNVTREVPAHQKAGEVWGESSTHERNMEHLFDDVSQARALAAAGLGDGMPPAPQFSDELLSDAPPPDDAPEGDDFRAEGDDGPEDDVEAMPTRDLRDSAAQVAETMPPQKLGEVPASEVIARPASMVRQVLAWTIDVSLWAGISSAYFLLQKQKGGGAAIHGVEQLVVWVKSLGPKALVGGVIAVGVALLYTALFTMALKGRTPGRLIAGIRLVTKKGETPGFIRAVLRTGFSLVSFATCCAGFWLALFDRRAQTLHDKLSGTFVVRLDS